MPTQLSISQFLSTDEGNAKALSGLVKLSPSSPDEAERKLRVAVTYMNSKDILRNCDAGSFLNVLMQVAAWNLPLDGRFAHVVPYKRQATLIVDYKGYVQLAYRHPRVKVIHADLVYEGDYFEYSQGVMDDHVPHALRTDSGRPTDRGNLLGAYCTVTLEGGRKSEFMTYDDIEAVRKRSRAGESGPWKTDWREMACKTVFRRCFKWMPCSDELIEANAADEDLGVRARDIHPQRGTQGLKERLKGFDDGVVIDAIPVSESEVAENDV